MSARKVQTVILHTPPQIVGYSNLKSQMGEVKNGNGAIRDLEMSFDGAVLLVTINKKTQAAIPSANIVSLVFSGLPLTE